MTFRTLRLVFSTGAPLAAALAATLLFTACAAPALYRPYSDSGDYGYSEVEVAKNRYEVYFHGPADLEDAAAKNFAIVRAAEIGKRNGFGWFRVAASRIRRETIRETSLQPDLFPQNAWTGESYTREEREQREWENARRRQQKLRMTVREEPVVQLTIQYRTEDCDDCLSIDTKVNEAIGQGILKP